MGPPVHRRLRCSSLVDKWPTANLPVTAATAQLTSLAAWPSRARLTGDAVNLVGLILSDDVVVGGDVKTPILHDVTSGGTPFPREHGERH
jgi:hypothetical protein